MVEILSAAALLAIAPWLALVGWGAIRNLFEESQDNEPWVYVAFGAPFWLAALLCVAGAVALLSMRPGPADHPPVPVVEDTA